MIAPEFEKPRALLVRMYYDKAEGTNIYAGYTPPHAHQSSQSQAAFTLPTIPCTIERVSVSAVDIMHVYTVDDAEDCAAYD